MPSSPAPTSRAMMEKVLSASQAVVPSRSWPGDCQKKEHQQESVTHRSTTCTELVVSRRLEAAAHPDFQTGVVSGTAKEQRSHEMLFSSSARPYGWRPRWRTGHKYPQNDSLSSAREEFDEMLIDLIGRFLLHVMAGRQRWGADDVAREARPHLRGFRARRRPARRPDQQQRHSDLPLLVGRIHFEVDCCTSPIIAARAGSSF